MRYIAGAQSGTAKIGAFSGGSKSEDLEILVGAAAAGAVSIRAATADRARPPAAPTDDHRARCSTPAAIRCAARR